MLTTASSFALPVPGHEAIKGLFGTSAFKRGEQGALATLRWYDEINVTLVGRSDSEMMATCYPSGAMSKSATNARVTFTNSVSQKSVVTYFTTSEKPSDFGLCRN